MIPRATGHASACALLLLLPAAAQAAVDINPTGGVVAGDGLRVFMGTNTQLQIQRDSSYQVYHPSRTPENTSLFNGIYVADGSTLCGPESGVSRADTYWTEDSQGAITGSGTTSDPYEVITTVSCGFVTMAFTTSYTAPNEWFDISATITSSSSDDIKLYHIIDTYLAGGDNGPAYVDDPTTPTIVGVEKSGIYEAFIQTTDAWDHFFSGDYDRPHELIEYGADLDDYLDFDPGTDNGIGVQWDLGVITSETIGWRISFTDDAPVDTDGDGLLDSEEIAIGTDPDDPDTDDDGLNDGDDETYTYGTDPLDDDTDDDGLLDGEEVDTYGTDPLDDDSDDDGLLDGEEVLTHGTDPLDADSDGGGASDGKEVNEDGTDPLEPSDDLADRDGDGLTDWDEEHTTGTDPDSADSDGDGISDGDEWFDTGTDPNDPDSDDDGLSDGDELSHGADPFDTDSDDDGLSDGDEVHNHGSDPTEVDSDGDGLDDGDEVNLHGTDPASADSDGDGLDDDEELTTTGTDPNDADSDGDGLDDGAEIGKHGSDPLDPDSDGGGIDDGAEVEAGSDPLDSSDDWVFSGGAGCSSLSGRASSPALLVMALVVLGLRRRRREVGP